MTMFISKFISKVIGEKGQWRQYKARTRQLPASYRTAVDALERYLKYFGTGGGGTAIYEDLVDLFEQSAANRTPIREIVGEDPVEFIEVFVRNYPKGQWIIRERERLTNAIERAAGEDTGREERAV
jgi:DNA-binding ferritin-like protein (Dps family)